MKKILIIATLLTLLIGCSKDDSKILDPNSKISISGISSRSVESVDSVKQIVEYFCSILWMSEGYKAGISAGRGERYYEHNGIKRDIENKKILFGGGLVIETDEWNSEWSQLGTFITAVSDIVFIAFKDLETRDFIDLKKLEDSTNPALFKIDTVAYIPNDILKKAQKDITDAYNKEDYETCYKLFDNAFVFVPITGAKWRELKAAGIE